jgi:hypothetical protein
MHIDFFVIFGQMRNNLINEYPQGQGVVGLCSIDLHTLVLDLTDFLVNRS